VTAVLAAASPAPASFSSASELRSWASTPRRKVYTELVVDPAARVTRTPAGLELRPSRPSIRKLP
jgi:hypothetical protein